MKLKVTLRCKNRDKRFGMNQAAIFRPSSPFGIDRAIDLVLEWRTSPIRAHQSEVPAISNRNQRPPPISIDSVASTDRKCLCARHVIDKQQATEQTSVGINCTCALIENMPHTRRITSLNDNNDRHNRPTFSLQLTRVRIVPYYLKAFHVKTMEE